MKTTRFFRILKGWCTLGFRFFFRTVQVNNVETIPAKGPVIFIPTHQNAFLDAILVICTTPRSPWSIARASVFKKGLVTKLLTAVQIKPVFRIRDGFSSVKQNDLIMQEWTSMLAEGSDIIIFAEGNHNEPYARGTLQRGFARMALKFQQQHEIPLTIVPVGIHYDDHHSFRSRVLVNYGDAIPVNDVVHASLTEREKLDALVDVTEKSLRNLALSIDPDDQYHKKFDYLMRNRIYDKDMARQLENDRKVLNEFPIERTPKQSKTGVFWKVINPIVWIGWTLNIIPYSIIKGFIRKNVKDAQFIGSLKYAFGIFLVPLYYLILIAVFAVSTKSLAITAAFAFIVVFSGPLATDILKK